MAELIFNNFTNSSSGHLNVTFIDSNGVNQGTYGANFPIGDNPLNGFQGGVHEESQMNAGRPVAVQTSISIGDAAFYNALNYAHDLHARHSQTMLGFEDRFPVCRQRQG